jgi:hypothetical protein
MRTLEQIHALRRKFSFNLWVDRLVFRGDRKNINDRLLRDIGLEAREKRRPVDPFWFI